jgi:polar amino acid transport system permease protein
LQATGYTVLVTAASFCLACMLGVPIALARTSTMPLLRAGVGFFSEFIRSTPILIQIYFVYFTLPQIGIVIPALATGLIVLSVHYATSISEAYRAGIASISRGQFEAAESLAIPKFKAFVLIVAPQAVVPIIPAVGNYLVSLFKETPLLSAIAIVEVLQRAKIIGSETFRYTEPITIVGVIFLVLSIASARLTGYVEDRTRRWR